MNITPILVIALVVIIPLMIIGMYPYAFDPQQAEYHQQCIDRYTKNGSSTEIASTFGMLSCSMGTQYPTPLSKPRRNITIKNTQILWLGDCKILTEDGEILHAAEDNICMASPGDSMWVYQNRIRSDNRLTSFVTVDP